MLYPDCMSIVQRAKETRPLYAQKCWWRYWRIRRELYAAIADMERVLVTAEASRTGAFCLVQNGQVFSHMLIVFAYSGANQLALLQSTFHVTWAWVYGSSLKGDLRYTPTDVFETFPFPEATSCLDGIGECYYTHRQSIMLTRQEGLTKTYNRFHDPDETASDICRLRDLHIEMGHAVAAAYGWDDLDLGHGFHQTKQGLRFTISEQARREVLGRLLALNHARYEEERLLGLHEKKGKATARKGKRMTAGEMSPLLL
jgi:hypothetical protein